MRRRTVLKQLGLGGVTVGAIVSTAAASKEPLNRYIREHGYYVVNNAGTRHPLPNAYRSKQPLRKETDTGGIVQVHPAASGIQASIDLTPEDDHGAVGFAGERLRLDDLVTVSGSTLDSTAQLSLWVEPDDDGEIFTWEPARGPVERRVSLDGGNVRFGPMVGPGSFEISGEAEFRIPGKESGETLDQLQSKASNPLARVLAGVGRRSGSVTVTDFAIESQ